MITQMISYIVSKLGRFSPNSVLISKPVNRNRFRRGSHTYEAPDWTQLKVFRDWHMKYWPACVCVCVCVWMCECTCDKEVNM